MYDKNRKDGIVKTLKELGKKMFDVYVGIGIIAMALIALLVGFSVVMRYCFSKSWKELSEFIVTLFAFTTFWGLGVNIIKNEHVMIDILYNALKPKAKRVFAIINYVIVLIVDLVFTYQGFLYAAKMGKQISLGMEIPMRFMYGIMPLGGSICAICILIKLIGFVTCDLSWFASE